MSKTLPTCLETSEKKAIIPRLYFIVFQIIGLKGVQTIKTDLEVVHLLRPKHQFIT